MCCIKNEYSVYEALHKKTPPVGSLVDTADGKGVVTSVNLLKGKLMVSVGDEDSKTVREYLSSDVKLIKKGARREEDKDELKELKELED
jgi:cell fate regulator YaaT (PSP1 superfamily)